MIKERCLVMQDMLLNTNIPPHIRLELLAKRLHAEPDTFTYLRASELIEEAMPVLKPAYLIKRFPVEEKTPRGIIIAGQKFRSRIMAEKLQGHPYAWIYITTSGREIADYTAKVDDLFDNYLLDEIAFFGTLYAQEVMLHEINDAFGICNYIKLSPGTVPDWSVEDVKKFFKLLDGEYQKLNVKVLDSGLIDPLKSTSGIVFPTEDNFKECNICNQANCPNREAAFIPDVYNEIMNNM